MRNIDTKYTILLSLLLPSLAGSYTALNYLETNSKSLEYWNILSVFGLVLLAGIVLLLFFRMLGFGFVKASLVATSVLMYFVYGNAIYLVFQRILEINMSFLVFNSLVFILVCLVVFLLRRSKSDFQLTVQLLTAVFLVGSVISVAKIALYSSERIGEVNTSQMTKIIDVKELTPTVEMRNIFYIILDRYADQRTLSEIYGFDNSEFTDMLSMNGFFVASNSGSNYPFTAQSLSSSLNMAYHFVPENKEAINGNDLVPFYRLIRNNLVTSVLKQLGYTYVHLGSWWMPSETSPLADENFQTTNLSRINLSFLHRSVIKPLLYVFNSASARDSIDPDQCDRVPQKLQRIKDLSSTDKPTFVFAHFLLPHDPFVFDKNGRCKRAEETNSLSIRENYLDHLQYSNLLVKQIVESLLNQPGPKPIIIIQADEGPYPIRYRKNEDSFQWRTASSEEIQQKMRILNAYYFPDVETDIFYESITPVNSFRLLFNSYFEANLDLLPDQNFAFPNNNNKYDFFQVTDIVKTRE